MTTKTRALLLQLEAFVAENNIRRSVLLAATNTQGQNNALSDVSGILSHVGSPSGVNYTFTCLSPNKATIVRTNGPVNVTLSFDGITNVTFLIDSLLVLTSAIVSLLIANPSTTKDVPFRIIQI